MAWNNHEVACLLAEMFGDGCACNFNGIDEWLPMKCDFAETACPHPVGVACWEQFLKHREKGGKMAEMKDYPPYLDYPKERKKQTNADKIRQMLDEELVDIWYFIYQNVLFAYTNSRQGLLDWLKQEVESDG